MYCMKCGYKIPENSSFCPYCGEKVTFFSEIQTSEKKCITPQVNRESSKRKRKLYGICIAVTVFLLTGIFVRLLIPNLKSSVIKQFTQSVRAQEQVQDSSLPTARVTEQPPNSTQANIPQPSPSPKASASISIDGLSDLSIEEQNNVLIAFIKSENADNVSQKLKRSSEYIVSGIDFNQSMIEITQHVIDGTSDLPIKVQNQVLINYIRSLYQ